MLNSKQDILSNIDETLDQLIANAEILTEIAYDTQLGEERLALESLQESLLSHLMSMDELLQEEKTKNTPQNIVAKLEKLDAIHSKRNLRKRSLVRR
ncbi:MAG: hypothetical protein KBC64_07205 [Simkaniaceae bacterium]|nr:hypothetical protein [Simkaniaceae bacterium]